MHTEYEPYENLANAIVILAAKDYRSALRREKKGRGGTDTIRELERFFRSPWCEMLTDVSGEYLIERIRQQVAEEN